MEALRKEFEYYIRHQDELVRQYNGKVVVIKDEALIGVFESELDALEETSKVHEPGTFLIQHCSPGDGEYTQTYRSRVLFSYSDVQG